MEITENDAQGFVFDEAQFDMDGKDYMEIKYFSGDMYTGELLGQNRHGFGMFTYEKTNEKVLGMWRNNYLVKEGKKHPLPELTGELIPLWVTSHNSKR